MLTGLIGGTGSEFEKRAVVSAGPAWLGVVAANAVWGTAVFAAILCFIGRSYAYFLFGHFGLDADVIDRGELATSTEGLFNLMVYWAEGISRSFWSTAITTAISMSAAVLAVIAVKRGWVRKDVMIQRFESGAVVARWATYGCVVFAILASILAGFAGAVRKINWIEARLDDPKSLICYKTIEDAACGALLGQNEKLTVIVTPEGVTIIETPALRGVRLNLAEETA